MNVLQLSTAYIKARALNSVLNIILLSLGIGTIVLLLLFGEQMQQRLSADADGLDLVVGAKGSPMQLILSSIYHIDVPTGNIPYSRLQWLRKNRLVKAVIPVALGDSYQGFRIVGTEHSYPAHYGVEFAQGGLWQRSFEVVIGERVAEEAGLAVGDRFYGSHGMVDGGHVHENRAFQVVGVLAKDNSVMDRLIMTSVPTVWIGHHLLAEHDAPAAQTHDDHEHEHEHEHEHKHGNADSLPAEARIDTAQQEITALLVKFRSPLGAVQLPRQINRQSEMQAARPAQETARLFALLGGVVETLYGFGLLLVITSGLGVFIALYNAMQDRRYDLAIMRSLGASRGKLLAGVILEGVLLVLMGTALGFAIGHGVAEAMGRLLPQATAMGLSGLVWLPQEAAILLLALGVALLASVLPAIQAYRTDIAETLSKSK